MRLNVHCFLQKTYQTSTKTAFGGDVSAADSSAAIVNDTQGSSWFILSTVLPTRLPPFLFRRNLFELVRAMHEIVGVSFWHNFSVIGLLHKILVTLFLSKSNRIFFGLKVEVGTLQEVCRRLPAHQWILPSVAFL